MAGSFGDWFGTLKNTFKVGKSTLSASGVSTARTHTLPDAAGTVALTTDTYGGVVLSGYISGLVLSNNATDANNDIDISVGVCSDSTGTYLLRSPSIITKRLDAAWAVGTNAGGLDTGSEAASTWYHVWAIRKDSDGSVDALFSTSVSSPTMPSGYTYKRLLGSVYNDASSNIRAFVSTEISGGGILTYWSTEQADVDLSNALGTTSRLDVISVPIGYSVLAQLVILANDNTLANVLVYSPLQSVMTVTNTRSISIQVGSVTTSNITWVLTNASGQVRSSATTDTINTFRIHTSGWQWGRR